MSDNTLSDQLKCHKCGQMLNNDQFDWTEKFKSDDETRTCIACSNADNSGENKTDDNNDKNKNKTSDKVEEDEMSTDTSPSSNTTTTTSTTPQKLYLNPNTKVWVPAKVMYTLYSGESVVRLDLGNKNFSEIILSASESNELIDFDKSIVGTSGGTTDNDDNKITKTVRFAQDSETTRTVQQTNKTSANAQVRLNKFVNIYNELKSQNAGNTVNDEMLQQLARDEYQIQINSAQQTTSPTTQPTYSELILREMRIEPFKAKFPKTHEKYWAYSHELEKYRKEFLAIPEVRLLEEILKSVNSEVKASWIQYTDDNYNELITAYSAEQLKDPEVPTQLRQTLNTISNYEKFIISRLDFNPDIIYFNRIVNNIYYAKDEMPLWFDQRFHRYIKNIIVVKERLNNNPNLSCNIRQYTDQEILEQYIRICTHDNNTAEYNNEGVLNQKVKFKISQWLSQRGASEITLNNFRSYLQTLHTSILPTGCGSKNPDGLSWKRFRFSGSVFQLRPPSKLSNLRKRSNPDRSKGDNNPTKRRKTNKGYIKEPCRGGVNCVYWLRNRKCRYQHTPKQIAIMDQKRSKSAPTQTPSAPTPAHWRDNKKYYNNSQVQRERCKYGAKCNKLERGACPFQHDWKDKICKYCKARGHFEFECRKKAKADQKLQNKQIPRYDPLLNPNANAPNPYQQQPQQQSLPIQYFNGEPYQMVMKYEKVESNKKVSLPIKNINNQQRLEELKSIQRTVQQKITAMQKNRSNNVESAYEQFMRYSNQSNN